MKKTELAVVLFMLAFCGFFYHETLALPENAQSYPLFVITLLAVLSVLQLVKMLVSCHGHFSLVSDADIVWKGFLPRQFMTFFIASVLFFVGMYFIGFYPTAVLYMGFMMHYFHIERKYILLTIVVLLVVIYAVFSESLNVPLPVGELLSDYL
jgi:putative tricarboxylic transport membrane protein